MCMPACLSSPSFARVSSFHLIVGLDTTGRAIIPAETEGVGRGILSVRRDGGAKVSATANARFRGIPYKQNPRRRETKVALQKERPGKTKEQWLIFQV